MAPRVSRSASLRGRVEPFNRHLLTIFARSRSSWWRSRVGSPRAGPGEEQDEVVPFEIALTGREGVFSGGGMRSLVCSLSGSGTPSGTAGLLIGGAGWLRDSPNGAGARRCRDLATDADELKKSAAMWPIVGVHWGMVASRIPGDSSARRRQ